MEYVSFNICISCNTIDKILEKKYCQQNKGDEIWSDSLQTIV